MIGLPRNATIAALAFALGLMVGLAGGRWLWHSPQQGATELPELPGTWALERDRPLQPRDTAGQAGPDVEIRYRTRTDTLRDTMRVPVPSSLTGGVVSDPAPIEVTPERATWTYWDPSDRRYEQREWRVPVDRYQASVYAVGLRRWQPRPTLQAGLGVEATLNPGWLPGTIEPFGEVRAGRQVVASAGFRWHFSLP
jgi:hypothetical protein